MSDSPSLIIVMGVSGSGKTTLGKVLARDLGYDFIDADDFHSEQAKKQMGANVPLTDEQRGLWITRIISSLELRQSDGRPVVMAYSGLKKKHRDRFRNTSFNVKFIWLHGEENLLKERLSNREGHFAKASLITSQLNDLEISEYSEQDIKNFSIALSPEELKQQAMAYILGICSGTKSKNK